jgi:bisphosphoglycerate-dependent phosphoglycerate mutase
MVATTSEKKSLDKILNETIEFINKHKKEIALFTIFRLVGNSNRVYREVDHFNEKVYTTVYIDDKIKEKTGEDIVYFLRRSYNVIIPTLYSFNEEERKVYYRELTNKVLEELEEKDGIVRRVGDSIIIADPYDIARKYKLSPEPIEICLLYH